jgi:DnaJ like chaperone protein
MVAAYNTLGLTSAATPEQVRSAFREKAKEYHPDKVAHMAPEFREVGERKMKEINEAYERIKRSWG